MRRSLPLLLLILSMSAAGQDFDYGAYKPAKLSTLDAGAGARAGDWFVEGHPRYRTRATFTGRLRPTPADTKKFIIRWVKAMGHPDAYADVFQQEIEITQDATRFNERAFTRALKAAQTPLINLDVTTRSSHGQSTQHR